LHGGLLEISFDGFIIIIIISLSINLEQFFILYQKVNVLHAQKTRMKLIEEMSKEMDNIHERYRAIVS